ncbi:MAG: MarR family transcriptional regulator [Crocinitomicaceae bacterium]|nr:MAG: MarR family transcriptional regulator [Crocinitomicaceae bacterium]
MEISQETKTRFKSPQQKVIVNIRYTSNWMANQQNAYMSKFDLTMPQFNILRILRGAKENGPISVNTVKERMIEKSPNTTRLMDKLIDKGLMERVRCESDRRIVYVMITDKGLDLLSEMDLSFETNNLLAAKLTDEEAEVLSGLLDKLRS